jgi:hypothetical protein
VQPVRALGEGEAVGEVRGVEPGPGIAVLEPDAPDIDVALQHRHRDAGLGQAVRRDQAGHPGTDHHDLQRPAGRNLLHGPVRRAGVEWHAQLVRHQRQVVVGDVAGHEPHQPAQRVRPRVGCGHRAAVPVGAHGRQRPLPTQLLRLLRHPALRLDHVGALPQRRAQLVGDQREVAGQVGEGRQQSGQLRTRNSGGERDVVVEQCGESGTNVHGGHGHLLSAHSGRDRK